MWRLDRQPLMLTMERTVFQPSSQTPTFFPPGGLLKDAGKTGFPPAYHLLLPTLETRNGMKPGGFLRDDASSPFQVNSPTNQFWISRISLAPTSTAKMRNLASLLLLAALPLVLASHLPVSPFLQGNKRRTPQKVFLSAAKPRPGNC